MVVGSGLHRSKVQVETVRAMKSLLSKDPTLTARKLKVLLPALASPNCINKRLFTYFTY